METTVELPLHLQANPYFLYIHSKHHLGSMRNIDWFGRTPENATCYCRDADDACQKFIEILKNDHGINTDGHVCGANGVVFQGEQNSVYKVQMGNSSTDYNGILKLLDCCFLPIHQITLFETTGKVIERYVPKKHVILSKLILNFGLPRNSNWHRNIDLIDQSARWLNQKRRRMKDVITMMEMPKAIPVKSICDKDIDDYIQLCMNLAKKHIIQFDAKFENVVRYNGKMCFIDIDEVCECKAHWRFLFLIMLVHTAFDNGVKKTFMTYIKDNFTQIEIDVLFKLNQGELGPFYLTQADLNGLPNLRAPLPTNQ